jgi:hypothetical protein
LTEVLPSCKLRPGDEGIEQIQLCRGHDEFGQGYKYM